MFVGFPAHHTGFAAERVEKQMVSRIVKCNLSAPLYFPGGNLRNCQGFYKGYGNCDAHFVLFRAA